MPKIGLIARMDKSGLGIQTKRLARLLKPSKLLLINSTPFNASEQHPEWYKEYDFITIHGFPTDMQIRHFLSSVDIVITCETFYSNRFTIIARDMNVKTICIANPEFWDYFRPQWAFIPLPNKVVVPSKWMFYEMNQRFNATYLPTPIFEDEFENVQKANLKHTGRKFLFMNGKTAANDRNGLESLYEALQLAKGKFTVTVKAQNNIKRHPDPRLLYDFSNPDNQTELYEGFDCLIQPRRYGGQTLSMCEALTCAMPVIMTNIDPNYKVLPHKWLVPAMQTSTLTTRIEVPVYSADPKALANMLDTIDLSKKAKLKAVELSKEYSAEKLKPEYEKLLK